MKTVDRQKICTQCDGRIPIESNECPYCGIELHSENSSSQRISTSVHKQSTNHDHLSASLYAPPYTVNRSIDSPSVQSIEEKKKPSAPPISKGQSSQAMETPINHDDDVQDLDVKKDFFSILLLTIAGILMVLGLMQFLFSDQGSLTLEWDSSYWFLYCLAALPLFYFGFKKVNLLK